MCAAGSSTEDDDSGLVVVHRNIDGDHLDSTECWCCPTVLDPHDDVAWAGFIDQDLMAN